MKKGDLKKQEILATAEELFCKDGYENTSVQDIIDLLHTSKGSFYHHYASKESVLQGICEKRAEQIHSSVVSTLDNESSVAAKINHLLSGMIPLRDEKLGFLLMFLPLFSLPEGRSVKAGYCDALTRLFLDSLRELLREGLSSGDVFCPDEKTSAEICLLLVHHLWTQIVDAILFAEENGEKTDLSRLLRLTEHYRLTLETILCLPAASLELISIPMLRTLCEQLHARWPKAHSENRT